MNKTISAIISLSLLVLPIVTLAQVKDYCTMVADLKYGDVTYKKGIQVWNPDAGGAPSACPTTTGSTASSNCSTPDWGTICLLNSIARAFNWVFAILIAIVGIMVVIGAFSIITAGGAPEKVTTGRNYILYALIGLVVAFFAKAIPAIVASLIR